MNLKLTFFFFLFINITSAQTGKIINNEATSFTINDKDVNIDFIVLDTKLETKKPIFLWCQGSLPYPLFVNSKDEGIWIMGGGITNFDLDKIKKHYHLVVISMPKHH